MSKITLNEENLFIIRSIRTKPSGEVIVTYYETPSIWNRSPMMATIFQNYEAGEIHLNLLRTRDLKDRKGWYDGSTEVIDVVPFINEIKNSPNVTKIEIKKK